MSSEAPSGWQAAPMSRVRLAGPAPDARLIPFERILRRKRPLRLRAGGAFHRQPPLVRSRRLLAQRLCHVSHPHCTLKKGADGPGLLAACPRLVRCGNSEPQLAETAAAPNGAFATAPVIGARRKQLRSPQRSFPVRIAQPWGWSASLRRTLPTFRNRPPSFGRRRARRLA